MLYRTTIPSSRVSETELIALVEQLRILTKQEIILETQFVILTESIHVSGMLDSLDEAISADEQPAPKPEKKRKTGRTGKRKVAGDDLAIGGVKPAPTRGPHVRSIKFERTGEMISRHELNKRLAARDILPGEVLHSPKYGTITVRNGGPEGAPYIVVNTSGEPV